MTAKFVTFQLVPNLPVNFSTFQFLSDNDTVSSILQDVVQACLIGNLVEDYESLAIPYNASSPTAPKPEQAVQYYRGSTAVLTLDGYNNTSIFRANGTADVSFPKDFDEDLLNCLNSTVGDSILLVEGTSHGARYSPSSGPVALVYLLWVLVGMLMM